MSQQCGKPTVHDIARNLSINASTVSRALNNHPRISDATKIAVRRMAESLGYQPHNIAAALRNGKSKIIGVIVPVADRNFFGSIVSGIEEIANKANYQVIICQTHEDPQKEAAAVEALLNSRVDGIIASLSKRTEDFAHFIKVRTKNVPLVLFDRTHEQLGVSYVVINDFQAGYKAVEHLIHQGCKRIAHFTNFQKIQIYKERLRGYTEALLNYGFQPDDKLIIESNMQLEDGRASMAKLLSLPESEWPDAVFSASDLAAMGALQILKERDIAVPERIALVGFANEPFTMFSDPPITSVDQHCKNMGNIAAEIFLEEIKDPLEKTFLPKNIVLMPELIVRRSSMKILKSHTKNASA